MAGNGGAPPATDKTCGSSEGLEGGPWLFTVSPRALMGVLTAGLGVVPDTPTLCPLLVVLCLLPAVLAGLPGPQRVTRWSAVQMACPGTW